MKVLIAEDDRVTSRLLARILEGWGYRVILAEDGNRAWEALTCPEAPLMAILDWEMPGKDGAAICRELRAVTREPYTYLVLLTARSEKADMIAGMQAGADDYLTKPFDMHELEVRLRAGKRIIELQDELIRARESLREMAMHDPLTGLYNRGAIIDILQSELARSRRGFNSVALVLADIDHFKEVNDTFGHLAGDEVLREVSRRLKDSARSYDSVGRYGGEEFLMVCPGCQARCASQLAERLKGAVRDRPILRGNMSCSVTLSMGIVVDEGDNSGAEELIGLADQAMYRAKHEGRDRVEIAYPDQLFPADLRIPPGFLTLAGE